MTDDLDIIFNPPKEVEETLSPDAVTPTFKLISRGTGPFRERYRPQKINEIVPTCAIEQIKNQIDNPNASQIFLFSGESGTGKTTCARILAKASVCLAVNTFDKPCLVCDSCQSFDSSFDVTELNAANQNKIEDIRNLVEEWRYAPAIFKKKIYILDEVQRLTAAAQQVLLTELEDPIPYLMVFLCTTDIKEINKALADRACKITFNRLSATKAREIIFQILKHEKLVAEEDVIESFYLQSRGSIRALLNCIQAYSENGFDPKAGVDDGSDATIGELYKHITRGDWPNLSKALLESNVRKDPEAVRIGLENYFRAVILRTPNLTEATKLGEALLRLIGSIQMHSATSQYNEFVLMCLRACSVAKPKI